MGVGRARVGGNPFARKRATINLHTGEKIHDEKSARKPGEMGAMDKDRQNYADRGSRIHVPLMAVRKGQETDTSTQEDLNPTTNNLDTVDKKNARTRTLHPVMRKAMRVMEPFSG